MEDYPFSEKTRIIWKQFIRQFQWIDILRKGDPYYNKNLSLTKWNYSLRPIRGMENKEK